MNDKLGVAILAAAALLLESALTRLLAVAQFYHFAFLAISLALLGFGASGSILTTLPRLAPSRLLPTSGIAFALSVALAYLVINWLPFDSYSIAWDRRQILYFALYYLVLTLPFLCAGFGIGGALMASAGRSHLVYAANLFGSAVGVVLAPLALQLAGVPGAVLVTALMGLSIALICAWPVARVKLILWMMGLIGLVGLSGLILVNVRSRAPLGMTISPYKGLAHARRYPGSKILFSRWNAISRVDVIAAAGTRQLPGLSYVYAGLPPQQYGLSLDAESPQPITLVDADSFRAAAYLPEALAFVLRPQSKVLVLEPGGGLGILQALAGGAAEVSIATGNPLVRQAVESAAPRYDVYRHSKVRLLPETPRAALARPGEDYTLVFLPLTDTYRPVTSGAYSLGESYSLTVEAFAAMLARLTPDGLLVVTRWLQTPPSEELRLVATLVGALERRGVAVPADALVAYRGIQTLTALVQPDGWNAAELATVRQFTASRRYDLVWAPDITAEETNRFNRLPSSVYYESVHALLSTSDRSAFYADYPFAISPVTDDHPFFFHFFTWKQTPELLATVGHTWQPFGGSGYFVLLALLVLVLIFSVALILAPLLFSQRQRVSQPSSERSHTTHRGRVFLYFSLLGLAFLFIEIPLIQRGILWFGHPTYAFTGVVVVLLTFSGLGSALARQPWLPKGAAFGALVVLALVSPAILAKLSDSILSWPGPARVSLLVIGLAPLATLMGLPFPFGLARLEARAPQLVPWAWAVNGCASVVAAVLAAILSLGYGLSLVLWLGAGCYLGAFWAARSMTFSGQRHESDSAQIGGL